MLSPEALKQVQAAKVQQCKLASGFLDALVKWTHEDTRKSDAL